MLFEERGPPSALARQALFSGAGGRAGSALDQALGKQTHEALAMRFPSGSGWTGRDGRGVRTGGDAAKDGYEALRRDVIHHVSNGVVAATAA